MPPSVAASGATVQVSEGMAATNSGTFSGPSATAVAVTASVGTVTQEVGNRGRWIWSLHPTDGPDGSQIVTITASDGEGLSSTITFGLTVSNAAPRISADSTVVTVTEGQTAITGGIFSDPGDDDAALTASVGTVTDNGDPAGSHAHPGDLTSGAATVSLTINPVNDAPVASSQSVTTDEMTGLVRRYLADSRCVRIIVRPEETQINP